MQAATVKSCSHSRPRVRSPCNPASNQALYITSFLSARRPCVMCQATTRCHYQVLGVEPTASADDIKRAFRKLALQLHPDVNPSEDAADAFKTAKYAYEVLSDPQQRAAYNDSRKRQARTYHRGSAWSGGSSRTRATQQQSRRPSVEYVVYDFDDLEEGDIDAAGAGFYGWYAQSGSWQSSCEANRKKQQRRQQQQQQQWRQADWQQQQQWQTVAELLQQQDAQTLGIVAQVFGEQLQHLSSMQELLDLLAGLELLHEEGIEPDATMFRKRSSRSSNSAGTTSPSSNSTRSAAGRRPARPDAGQTGSSSRQRPAGSSSQKRRTSTSSSRHHSSSSSSRSRTMPRFEEMGFDDLFAAMQDSTNPRVAQAAREFARQFNFADPALAADVEAFLTLEFLSGDWDDSSIFAGWDTDSSSSSRWQHASFDYNDYAARQKCRAKPGSARDYVMYEADHDDEYADVRDFISGNFGYVDVDNVIMQTGWSFDDDDHD